jgi:hypothetical protein
MTTTGATNLDILELSVPSIEADEINSGNAAAGHVLTADGAGGAAWQAPPGGPSPIDTNAIVGLIRYTWSDLYTPSLADLTAEFAAVTGRQPTEGDALMYRDLDQSAEYLVVFFDTEWRRINNP